MAVDPRKVLPTKINLIRLRKEHKVIKRIRGVLEEKRSALILYIRGMIEEYERIYKDVSSEMEKAYAAYTRAFIQAGYQRSREIALSMPVSTTITIDERILFSVKVPVISLDEQSFPVMEEVTDVPPNMLIAYSLLKKAFIQYIKLVELEYALRKLIEELKNTQRLINAIDNVVLPNLEVTIKHIKLVLEERGREEFLRLKIMKKKLG